MYSAIKLNCIDVLSEAKRIGMNTDGIKIFMRSNIHKILEIGKVLTIEFDSRIFNIPIVIDNLIPELQNEDGTFSSDIFICDPDMVE